MQSELWNEILSAQYLKEKLYAKHPGRDVRTFYAEAVRAKEEGLNARN